MRKKLDFTGLDQVIDMANHGMSVDSISDIIGIGKSTAFRIVRIYRAVERGDLDSLSDSDILQFQTMNWAFTRFGLDAEKYILQRREKDNPPPEEPEPQQTEPPKQMEIQIPDDAGEKKLQLALWNAEKVLEEKLVGAIEASTERIVTVITNLVLGINSDVNTNHDILLQEVQKCADVLGGIKQNTKKKGWNQP